MIEIIGYIAAFFVMMSFVMKNVVRLRVVNIIGCALWVVYGIMLDSYPIILPNIGIMAINSGHLVRKYLNTNKKKK